MPQHQGGIGAKRRDAAGAPGPVAPRRVSGAEKMAAIIFKETKEGDKLEEGARVTEVEDTSFLGRDA